MDNNVGFIKTIKKVADFEELVRRFAQKIYSADAFLIGGPYDGGRDLVYSVRNREIKQAIQISIQEKQIETKIEEDLEKTLLLISDHSYPPNLIFFWSQPISASKEEELKTNARKNYGITLEFFDANKIAQKITNEYPDVLAYLLEDIHKYKPSSNLEIDIRQRAFYDYLVLSKETASLKHVIIDSHIVSMLYTNKLSQDDVIAQLEILEVPLQAIKSRIGCLKKEDRVVSDEGLLRLTDFELTRINNLALKDQIGRDQVLVAINGITQEYTKIPMAEEILELIKEAYGASVDIQVSEENFEPPKLYIIKKAVEDIIALLVRSAGLSMADAKNASHELVETAAENEYLSSYCSTRLCIGLLNQSKLEKYIDKKTFFLYIDAPVFIHYLAAMRFPDVCKDGAFSSVKHLKESIKSLKTKEARVTLEHFEETVRHLENAEKISRFANDELIASLGDSKNVFFNLYTRVKAVSKEGYNFNNFLEDFIGFESSGRYSQTDFQSLVRCTRTYIEMGGIRVVTAEQELEDFFYRDLFRKFSQIFRGKRKWQTFKNDVLACQILGDESKHLDREKQLQTPMLITWDSTQHALRKVYREKRPHDEWVVYTPQRAIERLSMIDLRINSSDLKDGVLSIIDEDFFKDSRGGSLLDTLAIFLGDNHTEGAAVVSLLTKLTRRVNEEHEDHSYSELEGYNTLNEVLIFTQKEFGSDFSKVKKVFSEEKFSAELLKLLESVIKKDFGDEQKENYKMNIEKMVADNENIP